MRLLHLDVYEAASCGGLLDGISVDLARSAEGKLRRRIHPIACWVLMVRESHSSFR